MTRTIKTVRSNEANVSDRLVTYDCYENGEYKFTLWDVCDALDWREAAYEANKQESK